MRAFLGILLVALSLLVAGLLAVSRGDARVLESSAEEGLPPAAPPAETTAQDRVAVPAGNFTVEVLVNGVPLQEYHARGRRYVEALRGAEYEVRIRNPLPVRVAVALSVDGLNSIDARRSTGWDASKWVLQPYQTVTISGWQVSSDRARRFYFTSESDSYAARIGQPANLGVISAVFFRERPTAVVVPATPERDAPVPLRREQRGAPPESRADAGRARSQNQPQSAARPAPDDEYAATGIGRNMRHDVRWVNLNLDPRPVAQTTIRYEYREALVRLGIIPRPRHDNADALRRRERSTGFDDRRYSPEP